jgi:hypothetical protein
MNRILAVAAIAAVTFAAGAAVAQNTAGPEFNRCQSQASERQSRALSACRPDARNPDSFQRCRSRAGESYQRDLTRCRNAYERDLARERERQQRQQRRGY